jgi:3'-phosphoadenosine 5'-phosphosulfate sulfotransferase (PAPS reductase)/FAD synthetase
MKHVVMFSGGVGSWAAAKRIAERHGTDNLTLLFADTNMEDEDLYRFIAEAAANVGGEFVRIADGRTPWDVFRDERFIGNSRVAICSKMLKGKVLDRWLKENRNPDDTIRVIGIDWSEKHRLDGRGNRPGIRERLKPWRVEAPMCDPPHLTKAGMIAWLRREAIEPPRLYAMGFPHNNCAGFCIRAGQGHFLNLLKTMPKRYAFHERKEQELREYLGRDDIGILKDRRGGGSRAMTLRELRERHEAKDQQLDLLEWGGCGCALD